jgi:polyferredoxin
MRERKKLTPHQRAYLYAMKSLLVFVITLGVYMFAVLLAIFTIRPYLPENLLVLSGAYAVFSLVSIAGAIFLKKIFLRRVKRKIFEW